MHFEVGNSIAAETHMQNICICYHGEPSRTIFDIGMKLHISDHGHKCICMCCFLQELKEQINVNGKRKGGEILIISKRKIIHLPFALPLPATSFFLPVSLSL
ncbi:hypothetical protein ATANTOWER_004542 [Ataeniobius toweri]|uniref:Uncharacterized protein n=1 Tax=Ataeniobius toweri TaxID=208326 RepID=A0ABU7C6B9_9TELE|nr:hypothetical protein [Ataeniobius toweri]